MTEFEILDEIYLRVIRLGLKPENNPFGLMTLAFIRIGEQLIHSGSLEFKVEGGEMKGVYNFDRVPYTPWAQILRPVMVGFKNMPKDYFNEAFCSWIPQLVEAGYSFGAGGIRDTENPRVDLSVLTSPGKKHVEVIGKNLITNWGEIEEYCGKLGLSIEYK